MAEDKKKTLNAPHKSNTTKPKSSEKEVNEIVFPSPPIISEKEKIAEWVTKVKFKKKFIGGVDEVDVWKKIEELNAMYEAAIAAERARCNVILEEYKKACISVIGKNKKTSNAETVQEKHISQQSVRGGKALDE